MRCCSPTLGRVIADQGCRLPPHPSVQEILLIDSFKVFAEVFKREDD
jgi:hypothetical protein